MRIAVSGGSGFLGRATITAAENAGNDVWSFDRADGNDVLGDLAALSGADTVIHLAGVLGTAELFDNPEWAVEVNIKGTLRILEWCRANGAGYVGITMPPVFPSVYTATKVCAQSLATNWHRAFGVPVSHVRAFNAYGPGQAHGPGHPQKIVPTFARCAWEGQPIPVWGDGTQTVDLVHADDVGRMLVDAAGHGDDAVFDAGTGEAVEVLQVVRFVSNIVAAEKGPDFRHQVDLLPMRTGEEPTTIVAKGEGWDRLDWRPVMDWDRLADTVRWYR
jgi:nucleoside-diphosphate-sugar epimerase